MIRSTLNSNRRRRGAVLIVVLAMLVLFAVLGLSFVLYAESRASAARSNVIAENRETDPDAQAAAQLTMGNLLFGTTDELSIWRGHSLAELKYGYDYDPSLATNQNPLLFAPYAGSPIPNATPINIAGQGGGWNLMNVAESGVINYSRINTGGGAWFIFDPMRDTGATVRTNAAAAYTRAFKNRAAASTYPDRTNFFLAQQDPSSGRIVVPSFHRADLFGTLAPSNPNWTAEAGRLKTLRPRPFEHPNFPRVPMNADGTFTGDVQNMKYTAGPQSNDSIWMDVGGPVLRWRGKNYKAMVAPLILDLSGRVNLSIAGNRKLNQTAAGNDGLTASSQGLGPWEVDLQQIFGGAAGADLDTQTIIATRQKGANPPVDPYTATAATRRINKGLMGPQYSLLDPDADASRPFVANDAPVLPVANGFTAFPQFNLTGATTPRFPTTAAFLNNELANHPAQFNPMLNSRSHPTLSSAYGLDDLIRMTSHYSDPKRRNVATTSVPQGLTNLTPAADTAVAQTARALTTTYNSTQQWASLKVQTGPLPTDFTTLGPVDVNRTLPEYRKNTNLAASPLNTWNPTIIAEAPHYYRARAARHRLANDIFVRLCGFNGFIDGTSAVYNLSTGNVTVSAAAPPLTLQAMNSLAQLAANIVDYVDNDDISTAFVWNPLNATLADPSLDSTNFAAATIASRVVYGTELPRLVINEALSSVANERGEETTPPAMNRAVRALKRRYWLELHNPTPTDPVRSDAGAARLQYQTTTTQLQDPVTAAATPYTGVTFNPYRIEIADVAVSAAPPAIPYSTFLAVSPGRAGLDTASIAGMTLKARVDQFTSVDPAPILGVGSDELNLVRPATAATGPDGGNLGYYVIGPQDKVPTTPANGVTSTMSLADPAPGIPVPTAPVNALAFDATAAAPTEMNITDEAAKSSVILLRRLADPYRPLNDPAVTVGAFAFDINKPINQYITVDYLENVPTRDVARYSSTGAHTPAVTNAPSIGRIHPYTAGPSYGSATPMVRDQATATSPPHSFFSINNPVENNRNAMSLGFEWLVHLDRDLVSSPELQHVSYLQPALMTQQFTNGSNYQNHTIGIASYAMTFMSGLFEAGPRLPGSALGGRVPGKININAMNSPLMLNALISPQSGNVFSSNAALAATIWNSISPAVPPTAPATARTPNGVPGATTFEGGQDRPFIWGSAALGLPPDDTPIRFTAGGGTPAVFSNQLASQAHSSTMYEPLTKIWNNITPVSDSFLVMMTVGFFEVENTGPWDITNPPVLGRELLDKVPGDLRTQFAGVVDRSGLFTSIADTSAFLPTADTAAAPRPVQTKLLSDSTAGATSIDIEAIPPGGTLPDGTPVAPNTCAILGDGIVYTIGVGFNTLLNVGLGATTATGESEWVTVSGVAQRTLPDANNVQQTVPGQVTLTVGAVAKFHAAGSLVSNATLGHPGPQPGVTLKQLQQRGIVPYFTRIDP